MKFNWGTGVTLFFIFFAVCMTMAVVATSNHPPQMMQKDYYALDLNYQERVERKQNAAALPEKPTVALEAADQLLRIKMPAGTNVEEGTAHCYRSSTMNDDISVPFGHASELTVPARQLASGRWHVELDWVADGKKYFWETTLALP